MSSRRSAPLFFLVLAAARLRAGEGDSYVYRLDTKDVFEAMSVPERFLVGVDRTTKFLIPIKDDTCIKKPVFQNVNKYKLHQEFLKTEFSDCFPALGGDEYLALVERRATRSYFAGVLWRFAGNPDPPYGFDLFTLGGDPTEFPQLEEARAVHTALTAVFTLGPVAYAPRDLQAIKNAQGWTNPGFPISNIFGSVVSQYIAYTSAENYGRVRVLTANDFDAGNNTGAFTFQDILVLPLTPTDIQGVIAGVVTDTIQGELGHLAIRTGRRGTPNCYLRNATTALKQYDGKLVHIVVAPDDVTMTEATLEQAEAWWSEHRPPTPPIVEVDPDYKELDASWEMKVLDYEAALKLYGGKATNGAILYGLLPPQNRGKGFAIPYYYYIQFMESNTAASPIDPTRQVTFTKYIEELISDPLFRSDSRYRYEQLAKLRDNIEHHSVVDSTVVRTIALRVLEIYGSANSFVRFRSSSNVEHLLEFNGAGLHESTSGCAADDLDADQDGPSRCDPSEKAEHGVLRALKVVWASLWNFRAYEEREYYKIPQMRGRMAIWVFEAFTRQTEELVNGVAFSGNPDVPGDRRFIVTSQLGDTPVVSPPPGVIAEKDLLEMETGAVKRIIRIRPSNLAGPGELVLDEDRLKEIGSIVASVEKNYPVGTLGHPPEDVLMDMEFKITQDHRLVFKDVRQFLIATGAAPLPVFTLHVPAGLTACGSFTDGRLAATAYRLKAQIGLKEGDQILRADGTGPGDLFEWIQLSENGSRLTPAGPGIWTSLYVTTPYPGYQFELRQDFQINGEPFQLILENFLLGTDSPTELNLDAPTITWATNPYRLRLRGDYGQPPDVNRQLWFLPCDVSALPLYKVDVQYKNGDRAHFEERFDDVLDGTGPAELVSAELKLGGETIKVNDYWHLVYTAGHHNEQPFPEHWAVFKAPRDVPGVGRAIGLAVQQGFKGNDPENLPRSYWIGEDLKPLAPIDLVLFRRAQVGFEPPPQFRRGDADSSGKVTVSDAIAILRFKFEGADLGCQDAADFDDQGTVEIDDAILLLAYMFLGLDPPAPPGPDRCGADVEVDELPDCNDAACR